MFLPIVGLARGLNWAKTSGLDCVSWQECLTPTKHAENFIKEMLTKVLSRSKEELLTTSTVICPKYPLHFLGIFSEDQGPLYANTDFFLSFLYFKIACLYTIDHTFCLTVSNTGNSKIHA